MASLGNSQTRQLFAPSVFTYLFSDNVAIRVHSDSQPHNLKTASLQKGLILLWLGKEIVGEGVGFGVPIAKYQDETYFSTHATVQVIQKHSGVTIKKEYSLDTLNRTQYRTLKLENQAFRKKIDAIANVYQNNKHIALLMLKSKSLLTNFGVQSHFVNATPKGKISVTYLIQGSKIKVDMDFNQVNTKNLQQIFVLNEQGAHFFRKYSDSSGLTLHDAKIGVWDWVAAEVATLAHPQNRLCFSLKQVNSSKMRRGREVAAGYLDWAGLDYELPPLTRRFSYEIGLSGAKI
jgi:hypothetical protein